MARGGTQGVMNSIHDWPFMPVIVVTIATITTTTNGCHGNQKSILECLYCSYQWFLHIIGTNHLIKELKNYISAFRS